MGSDAVPLCDIAGQYRTLQAELDAAVLNVLHSGQAILGPEVMAFERETAHYCGSDYALGCSSGTDAIVLALTALDIGPGDEVIIPPFTFFATAGSVVRVGATPVFVDIDPESYNIDPALVERKITSRTKAIMPVHLFGQCAEMNAINEIAARYGVAVIEDAAQSFGSEYQGKRCGTLGDIACFSFYPSKNLGTLGDAGLIATNDPKLHQKLVALRNHGSEVKYYHKYVGWNGRIDALHAAILRVKLPHVDRWLAQRRAAALRYHEMIEDAGLESFLSRPIEHSHRLHTYNQYVVRVADNRRDAMIQYLKSEQIGCEVYYPLALHQQECLTKAGQDYGRFAVSEEATREVLALPMFPEITIAQQQRVIAVCQQFMQANGLRAA